MNLRQKPLIVVFRLAALLMLLLFLSVASVYVAVFVFRTNVQPLLPAGDALLAAHYEPKKKLNYSDLNISTRPLFWASRRPVIAEVEPTVAPAVVRSKSTLDNVKLLGIMGKGESAQALLLRDEVNYKLQVGESLDGWVLQEISPVAAVFVLTDAGSPAPKVKKLEMNVRKPLSRVWNTRRELGLILDNN